MPRPGGTGAAEPFEPRQVRDEAAVRKFLWAPPANLPGAPFFVKVFIFEYGNPSHL